MTSTTRSRNLRSTGRRLVGAVSSAAAVAVIGVSALTPQTAAAAGIAAGHRHAARAPSAAGPASLPVRGDAGDVTYRWTTTPAGCASDRLGQPTVRSLGHPAHSTQPGSA